MRKFTIPALFTALLLLFSPSGFTESALSTRLKFFSSFPSRMPGTDGHNRSADYIENAFREAGLRGVAREQFFSTVPVEKGSYVSCRGKKIPVSCVWPNLVRTSTTPSDGLAGTLVYGGNGNPANLSGINIRDAVIVLDFNCGNSWVDLMMLGAKACIFIENGPLNRTDAEKKYLDIPINAPRFYAGGAAAQQLRELAAKKTPARLYGRMDWEKAAVCNIYGRMEGSDAKLSKETVILQAYYDSISVTPGTAPGADSACGISVLLEALDFLKANPPKRSVLFLAVSGHYEDQLGITQFINTHLRAEGPFKSKIKKEDRISPVLFIGLDLAAGSDEVGIWHNSVNFNYQRFFAPFGKKFTAYAEQVCRPLGFDPGSSFFNGISPEKGVVWTTFLPELIRTDGEKMMLAGLPALSLITVNDGRWRVDTPADTYANLNLPNIEKQSVLITRMLKAALNDPDLLPDSKMEVTDELYSLTAKIVTFNPKKSFVPDQPVKDGLIVLRDVLPSPYQKNFLGARPIPIGLTGEAGTADFALPRGRAFFVQGFQCEPETGEIIYAPDMGVNGNQQYPVQTQMDFKEKKWVVVLFECKPINLYSLVDPQYLTQLNKIDVFDLSNSFPDAYGSYLQYPLGVPWVWSSYSETAGVVFAKPHSFIKVTGESGPLGKRLLLLNSKESSTNKTLVEGEGFPTDETRAILDTPYQAAKDMIILDTFRAGNFEQYGIRNERLRELQDESSELLKQADRARKERNWFDFLKFARQAQAVESRAYPDVKSTANDVVQGIIFYFILLLPFAYFGERLFFGFARLEKRIAGIFGIFLAIYWVMRLVHPAFKLTNAPEVILLSFIVFALSFIVLSIVASKFEEQMQRMKKESAKVYQTDVGRVTAAGTAFSLGVANMKRRKTRTILTSITLILLTFTVLSFTSIKSFLRFNQIPRFNRPLYQGLLLRDRAWSPLQEIALTYTSNEFSDGTVAPRAWFIIKELGSRTAIEVKSGNKTYSSSGLLGLTPQEQEITPVRETLNAGGWFTPEDTDACVISTTIARSLGIRPEDAGKTAVRIYGRTFLVKGIFDAAKFNDIRDLDDEKIAPVDFSSMPEKEISKIKMEKTAQVQSAEAKIQSFTHTEGENIVILPYNTVMEMGGTLQSVAVRLPEPSTVRARVESFISKLAVTIFAGIGDKTSVYSSLGATSFAGISNIIIPILIAALIVLNTMLGSVYERIKEIGTYSAVGLAPVHIGSLFLAESLVYAVLGAVAGYLLGQVVAHILMVTGLLSGLVLNYSSLSAVFATIIIVVTVLLSTLYPARKASRMAVPDVTRRWTLPDPKGDRWEFEFPFTVSEFEVLGLVTFLTDYFNTYQDVSLGTFYTNGAALSGLASESGKERYSIETEIWLAPFDLGVSQKMTVHMRPLGRYNFYTIDLAIARTSGESTDWKRLNRRFIDGIRKQFLIWRTVSPEVKKDYEAQGQAILQTT